VVRLKNRRRLPSLYLLTAFLLTMLPLSAFAQGSIFGTVTNSDVSSPANGEITFYGFLDDTDEELRIETATGAGYDAGNWFDDFQNYLTEAPGNPYDYYFFNVVNGEGAHLANPIPNNSFQQENIVLAPVAWPGQPVGLSAAVVSSSSLVVEWDYVPGLTYHVYRRTAASNGSFFRVDDPAGLLTNPGTADSFYVDNTVDGATFYDYLVIAQDGSGNYSRHSDVVTINSAAVAAPTVIAITPDNGLTLGGTPVTITGTGFDVSGAFGLVGSSALTDVVVVSPYEMTGTTGIGTAGAATITVTNIASSQSGTLPGGFTYVQNSPPVLAAIGPQSVTENTLLTITPTATDADLDIPAITTSTLPAGAAFVDNGNGSGTLTWTPTFLESGTYNVTFYATDAVEPSLVDSEQVVITVTEAGNQLPVLAAIGPQGTTENTLLSFAVAATDAESTPVMTTSALPGVATFVDNGDGTGAFNWTPDFAEAGVYPVTFYATDDSTAVDSEIVTITILDAGNQEPVLAAIGSQSTTENVLLSFGVSASDPDGTIPALTTSTLPGTATFTDAGDGTGAFTWTPSFTDAGSYPVTFYAGDGVATDSEIVTITVLEAGNQTPVLAAIGPQGTTEAVQLLIAVTATDAEGIPTLTTSALPGTATFVDAGDGTGTFDWTPTYTDAGSYPVTFYAGDGVATDSEVVTITVADAGNQTPVLAAIGPQGTTEGILLTFGVSAGDIDGTIPVLTTSTLPGTATFVDAGDGTGTFDWTPTFVDAGAYPVTFYAGDGVATDSEVVTITVTDAGNQAPVLAAIGAQNVSEGALLNFVVAATDADGTFPVMTTSTLPGVATFVDGGDGTGTFDWTPDFTEGGTYDVTFYAGDGTATDSEVVTITVFDSGNQSPVLAAIGDQSTTEGIILNFDVTATDADGTIPTFSSSALPGTATFVDNTDGSATFDWTPTFVEAGTYPVTFYATDGLVTDSEAVTITVIEAGNQAPVLAAIGPQNGAEAVLLTFVATAGDPDGTIPTLGVSGLPGTATFLDNGDGSGTFDWTPDFIDAGSYDVTFFASDGTLADSEIVTITIAEAGNQAPVLDPIGPQATSEGVQLLLSVTASDLDGEIPTLTTSALPGTATFTDNLDGTGSFDWTPAPTMGGIYDITFYASDGVATDSELVTITVTDVNQPPVLAAIGPQTAVEGDLLAFVITASDVDGDIPVLTTSTLPGGVTFVDNLDGTANFDWPTTFIDAGVYDVTFYATDAVIPSAIDSEIVTITITDLNQLPDLQPIGSQNIPEGGTLVLSTSATDADGDIPIMTTSVLPGTATYIDNLDGTGSFEWITSFADAGTYSVTFYATDAAVPTAIDSEMVTIIIGEAGNQAPVFAEVNDTTINEGQTLVLSVSAIDFAVNTTFQFYTFVDNGDGTGTLTYSPTYDDAGLDSVRFIASDDATPPLSRIMPVAITTIDFNQPPQFVAQPPVAVDALDTLRFTVEAFDSSDVDGGRLYLSVTDMPLHAQFTDHGDNTGTLTFAPDLTQIGVDTVHFIAVDDDTPSLTGNLAVEVTVRTINQPPVLEPIGPQQVFEGATVNVNLAATDPEGAIPFFETVNAPSGSSLIDNGDGTAVWSFTPSFVQSGLYYVTFRANDGGAIDNEVVLIQVLEAGDQTPYFTFIPSPSVVEGGTGGDSIVAVDPDGDGIVMSVDSATLATNMSFLDNGDGTAIIGMAPDFTQAGLYDVTVIATAGPLADTAILTFEVVEFGNHAPTLATISDQTVMELTNLQFVVTASDIDGVQPVLSIGALPGAGASFDPGSGTFSWTPGIDQQGTYPVWFYATDGDPAYPTDLDSQEVIITVTDTNRVPWYFMNPTQPDTISEGNTLTRVITAWDDDGPTPTIEAHLQGSDTLATNMVMVDSLNGVGVLTFTPDAHQGDTDPDFYYVRFVVRDSLDPSLSDSSSTITFRVFDLPQAPTMTFSPNAGPFTVSEGATLTFDVTAIDPDGLGIPIFSVENLPANATTSQSINRLDFSFTPDFLQAGQYFVSIIATDADVLALADTQVVEINVVDAGNQAPYFSPILPDTVAVYIDVTYNETIIATDPDGDPVTLTATTTLLGSALVDNGDGTALMIVEPDAANVGSVVPVTFTVQDAPGGLSTDMVVQYQVLTFMRGDLDASTTYSINDIVYLANYLFRGGPPPSPMEAGDVDLSGAIQVSDLVYMVNFLYNAGPRPPQ